LEKDFFDIIQLMVKEQGKDVLVNGKAQKFLADYCGGQFQKESKILRQILDAKCGEYINNADNVLERKRQLAERLEDGEDGLSPKVTAEYLDLLGLILRGDTSKTNQRPEEMKVEEEALASATAALLKYKNKTFLSNQDARRFHNAIRPPGTSGWQCNFANTIHPDGPNECDQPAFGGYWV